MKQDTNVTTLSAARLAQTTLEKLTEAERHLARARARAEARDAETAGFSIAIAAVLLHEALLPFRSR